MIDKEEIPMIEELLDLSDKGELQGEWFIYYPTSIHKERDSRWYAPRKEIEATAAFRKKYHQKLFWGK